VSDDKASDFEWKRVYQGALLETDLSKIRARTLSAQIAIPKSGIELVGGPFCREHQELDETWHFLYAP